MRKAFNFYASYDDVMLELNDKQLVLFIKALRDVQFLRKHIDEIVFDDKLLSILWKSTKYQISKQVEGYCNKNHIDYKALFYGAGGATVAGYGGASLQEEGQGEGEGEAASPQSQSQSKDCLDTPSMIDAKEVAQYLLDKIVDRKSNFKKPTLTKWSEDIDKAIRIDGRTKNGLLDAIDWIYDDKNDKGAFWIANILSGNKLRKQYDTIESQAMGA